jgi:hypothetical protein
VWNVGTGSGATGHGHADVPDLILGGDCNRRVLLTVKVKVRDQEADRIT